MALNKDQIEKIKRWAKSPIEFINDCIVVTHPVLGVMPFYLYPFQRQIVTSLETNRFNILRKFRQAGCTTIACAYALWFCLFNRLKTVVVLSKGDIEAMEFVDRIKTMYDNLPKWMLQIGDFQTNVRSAHKFEFKNGSSMKSRSSGKDSGRSLAASLVILDEAAFIDNIETIWNAARPTIATGGNCFVLSTVNGIGNWYHKMWEGAPQDNGFVPLQINWRDHPQYMKDDEWEKEYKKISGGKSYYGQFEKKGILVENWEATERFKASPRLWRQEYECEFLGTGETYVDGEVLTQIYEQIGDKKNYYTRYSNRMRIFKEPHPAYEYLISVDCSLGTKRDFTAFHVINIYNGEQVAEFYSNVTPVEAAAKIVAEIGLYYNQALVIPERNTIGLNFIDHLNQLDYENIWVDDKNKQGFQVSFQNREVILGLMEEYVRNRVIKINSLRTATELLTFIVNDQGKAEADEGCHDDLVMSLALASFALRETISTTPVEHQLGGHNELPANAFSKTDPYTVGIPTATGISKEDIRWLLGK
jgi:hypothetical protein